MTAPVLAIPDNPDDFAAVLLDKEKLKAATDHFGGGPDGFRKYTHAYTKALDAKSGAILKEQIAEQTQIALAELLAKQGDGRSVKVKRAGVQVGNPAAANPEALGAKLDGQFGSIAELFQLAWTASHPSAEMLRRGKDFQAKMTAYEGALKAYQEKIPSEGGFLVPEEYRSQLLTLGLGASIVRPRAVTIPMSSATLTFPAIDETSRVSSVFGGVVVYRTEEGAELTESAATFAAVKLVASKQTALAHVTNELVRDVPAFTAYIEQTFPPAMAFEEDYDFITGTGAGEPLGMLHSNNTALLAVAKETSQVASTIVWENVLRMYSRFYGDYNRALWIASPDTFFELATMALTVGTGGSAVWITDGVGRPQLTLLGAPVILTEKAPAALGAQGDLSLVDPGFYLIGDRQMVTVEASPHVKFTSDKTTFRAIARNDGRPWIFSPLTPRNASATMSPFVTLQVRA